MPLNPCRARVRRIDASRSRGPSPASSSPADRLDRPVACSSIVTVRQPQADRTVRASGRPRVRSGRQDGPAVRVGSVRSRDRTVLEALAAAWRSSPGRLAELGVDLLDHVAARVDDHRHAGLGIAAFHLGRLRAITSSRFSRSETVSLARDRALPSSWNSLVAWVASICRSRASISSSLVRQGLLLGHHGLELLAEGDDLALLGLEGRLLGLEDLS